MAMQARIRLLAVARSTRLDALALVALLLVVLPNAAVAQSHLAECIGAVGDKAIVACTRAIKASPKNWIPYHMRGLEWINQGNNEKAIIDLGQAIKLNPKDAAAYRRRGYALREKAQYDKAIADYNQAIKLNRNDAYSYLSRGIAWSKKNKFDKAIADFKEAIKLNPNDSLAYFSRAETWEKMGKLQLALTDFKKYSKLRPSDPAGAKAIARVTAHLGSIKRKQSANSPQGRRVALIIGNTNYQYAPALQNPGNDALLLAMALRASGFQSVTVKTDLGHAQMIRALRDFSDVADDAQWAILYFSGHGVEFGGVNYMIPVDARLKRDRDIDLEAVATNKISTAIHGAKKLRLVILDMCRDNPFKNQMRRTMATRSMHRGLARVEPNPGTLVVYAAKHGEVALDGDGQNSPFAQALVQRIKQRPPVEIRRLFDFVRDDVLAATKRRQMPFSYGSLPGSVDFFFGK